MFRVPVAGSAVRTATRGKANESGTMAACPSPGGGHDRVEAVGALGQRGLEGVNRLEVLEITGELLAERLKSDQLVGSR